MDSSLTEVSIFEESLWGVVPVSPVPAFSAVRITGESLKLAYNTVESEEIRADRNTSGTKQVGGEANGGITGELTYGTYDKLLESALFSTFDGVTNSMVNGITPKSFTIQKKQSDGVTSIYTLFNGMIVNTVNTSLAAQDRINIDFGFVGKGGSMPAGLTGTVADPTTSDMMEASSGFTLESFLASPVPDVMDFALSIDNGLVGRPKAGSKDLVRIGANQCRVTGSASMYFKNKNVAEMFINDTKGEIQFLVGETGKGQYRITCPNVTITDSDHFSTGNGEEVMLNITWKADYDDVIEGTIEIERIAPSP